MVNDCYAHNGANKRIQLIDQHGCPVDDKLISRFRGSWSDSGVFETQVYAYMKTFRFTGSPALYIECDVRMCHGRCPVRRSLQVLSLKICSHIFLAYRASPVTGATWRRLLNVTLPTWRPRISRCLHWPENRSRRFPPPRVRCRRMWICFNRCVCCKRAKPMATMSMRIGNPRRSCRIRPAWRHPRCRRWRPAAPPCCACWQSPCLLPAPAWSDASNQRSTTRT